MFQDATRALDQLHRLDRGQGHGDLRVVAAGRTEVDLMGGHVGIDAGGDAHDLGMRRSW